MRVSNAKNIKNFDKVEKTANYDVVDTKISNGATEKREIEEVDFEEGQTSEFSEEMKMFENTEYIDLLRESGVENIESSGPDVVVTLKTGYELTFFAFNGAISLSSIKFNDGNNNIREIDLSNVNYLSDANIKRISVSRDGKNIVLTDMENKTFVFDIETGRIVKYIDTENLIYIKYDYDVSSSEKQELFDLYGMDSNTEVNYISEIFIRGNKLSFYSVGEQDYDVSSRTPITIANQLSLVPDDALSTVLKSDGFFGVISGPFDIASNPDMKGHAAAYVVNTYGKRHMFLPTDGEISIDSDYTKNAILHEFGHLHQDLSGYLENPKVNRLWTGYRNNLIFLKYGTYVGEKYENDLEFYADSFRLYCENPDKMKEQIPELYYFMNSVVGDNDKKVGINNYGERTTINSNSRDNAVSEFVNNTWSNISEFVSDTWNDIWGKNN